MHDAVGYVIGGVKVRGAQGERSSCRPSLPEVPADLGSVGSSPACMGRGPQPKMNLVHFKRHRTPLVDGSDREL